MLRESGRRAIPGQVLVQSYDIAVVILASPPNLAASPPNLAPTSVSHAHASLDYYVQTAVNTHCPPICNNSLPDYRLSRSLAGGDQDQPDEGPQGRQARAELLRWRVW